MRKLLPLVLLLLSAGAVQAEPEVYTLDNGLTVILDDMHFAPTAVVMVQYQVGARNETAEISGISHFTEHMMFNGTPDMPGSTFWQHVQMEGGNANGGTGTDQTTYFIYMPSSKLEKAMSIEADRMVNCLMDSAAIAQEIGVVTDEWRLSQDNPDRQLYYAVNEAWFGDHPRSRTVLGTGETIAAYNEQSVRDYYETWYRPSNAFLVIAGDFQRDQARELVDEYFGTIPCDGPSPDNVPSFNGSDHPERVDIDFPAEADRFMLLYPGCSMDDPDLPALMVLDSHFSGGRLGWITREMVNKGLLTGGYAYSPNSLDNTPFGFQGTVTAGTDVEHAIELITDEAYRLTEEELSDERLQMLKDYMVASELSGVTTPLGQAYEHAFNMSLFGDIEGYDRILEDIQALTPEEIREVAARHFKSDELLAGVLHATEGAGMTPASSTAGTTETDVPEVTDWSGLDLPTEFQIPGGSVSEGVESITLDNGLLLLVKEDHSFPNVEIMMTVPMGVRMEDPELCGISSITSELMQRGTEELPYDLFHERLAVLGSSTWMQTQNWYSMANAYGLSEHTEVWFNSLADMMCRPALTEEDFQSVKDLTLARLARREESTFSMAFDGIDEILLASGNSRNATLETVEAITREEVLDWWQTCVRPDGAVIAVVGDVTVDDAIALTEEYFGDWENPDTPLPERVEYDFSTAPGDTMVVSMPGKIQIVEVIGCRAPARDDDDYAAFNVMSRILGGGIGSRLGQNVRETQGLAYMVASGTEGPTSSGSTGSMFYSYLATGAPNASRALASVLHESARMENEDILIEELLLEKSRSVGRQAMGFDSYDSQARYLASSAAAGLPLDRDITYLEQLIEVTPGDVKAAAARYFSDNWFVVAAGGIDESMEPLEGPL